MADEIPTELRPTKRMALTQDELALIIRRREAETKHKMQRQAVGQTIHDWAVELTTSKNPAELVDHISVSTLTAALPNLLDRIVPPFEG